MGRLITLEDARMAAWRDVPTGQLRTTYFLDSPAGTELPQCFRVENTPHRHLDTHFHEVDQFQVILEGSGTLGKHDLAPCLVHFARAYTPYGPIVAGPEGLAWLSIRMKHDDGAQYMPASRAALDAVEDRDPWQWSESVAVDDIPIDGALHGLNGLRDAEGLGAFALRLAPGMTITLPDPSDTGGQFVVMVRGGIVRDGDETRSLATMMNAPQDGPVVLTAGGQGLDALVLDFPRARSVATRKTPQPQPQPQPPQPHAVQPSSALAAAPKLWHCAPCGFVYDESAGSPGDGIAPGTLFAALPQGWHCPDCGAGRDDFSELDF